MTRALAAVVVAALLLVSPGALAHAQPPTAAASALGISPDGREWSHAPATLFDTATPLIPGGSLHGPLQVRNETTRTVRMTIAARLTRTPGTPPDLLLTLTADGRRSAYPAGELETCRALTTLAVPPGAAVGLDVTVTLPWTSSNDSRRGRWALQVFAAATDGPAPAAADCSASTLVAHGPTRPVPSSHQPVSASLASTGGPAAWAVLVSVVLASGGVAGGLAALARRRRTTP